MTTMPSGRRARWLAAGICAASMDAASGHGFGQRFDLPLPLGLWVAGAGATVVLSFAALVLFLRERRPGTGYPRRDLLRTRLGRALAHSRVIGTLRAIAAVLSVTTVLAGLLGTVDTFRNLAPTMIWVIWWVGLAFVCALAGDLWALVNPLRTIFAWTAAAWARVFPGRRARAPRPYPRGLAVWPSVAVLFGFAWAELVWGAGDVPFNLALLAGLYAVASWAGMRVFGREVWLRNAEAFSVTFALFARFAPLELRVTEPAALARCPAPACRARVASCVNGYACLYGEPPPRWEWNLRPPAVGLLNELPVSTSMMVFVVLMLSTVTFDGLMETPFWLDTVNRAYGAPGIARGLHNLDEIGWSGVQLLMTLALLAIPALFLGIFALCCWSMTAVARMLGAGDTSAGVLTTARYFVPSLVPIAIAYHLAHYLSMLLTSGQFVIPLLSDPFGFGWDLWGTAHYRVDFGVVNAATVWYSAVIAIVLGHVCSVYLAHATALAVYGDLRKALIAHLPLLALMVLYTMTSLWILAQPIVG